MIKKLRLLIAVQGERGAGKTTLLIKLEKFLYEEGYNAKAVDTLMVNENDPFTVENRELNLTKNWPAVP